MSTAMNVQHGELHARAHVAGMAAGEACIPTPVQWQNAQTGERFAPEPEGMCGFAWINVRPGTSSFARWLKRADLARRAYHGGLDIWVRQFNQSHERKVAYARAYADVLQDAGVTAYAGDRLD